MEGRGDELKVRACRRGSRWRRRRRAPEPPGARQLRHGLHGPRRSSSYSGRPLLRRSGSVHHREMHCWLPIGKGCRKCGPFNTRGIHPDGIKFLIARLEISVICPSRLKAGDVVVRRILPLLRRLLCAFVLCCSRSLAFTARVGKVAHSDVLGKKIGHTRSICCSSYCLRKAAMP